MAQAAGKGSTRATRTTSGTRRAGRPQPAALPLCSVPFCPICMAVTAVGEARPEFVDHLATAGRELLLAMRALIDARLEGMEPSVKLERLTIE